MGGVTIDSTLPSIFYTLEATIGILGAEVVLLAVFSCCLKTLAKTDAAKPFLSTLGSCLTTVTVATICQVVFRKCGLPMQMSDIAVYVSMIGQFAAMNSLLFGGGFYLLEIGNAARTGGAQKESGFCCNWLIHSMVCAFSIVVMSVWLFGPVLEYVPLMMVTVMPTLGCIFLLFGLVFACFIANCGDEQKNMDLNGNTCAVSKCADSKFAVIKHFLFFLVPAGMILLTRGINGGSYLVALLTRRVQSSGDMFGMFNSFLYSSHVRILPGETEYFFSIAIVLSALVFLPSIRNIFCCAKKCPKTKIAPEPLPAHSYGYPIMMATPMSMSPSQLMTPAQSYGPGFHHLAMQTTAPMTMPPVIPAVPSQSFQTSVPTHYQYPTVVYGMGGKPYMMA